MKTGSLRVKFITLWAILLAAKLFLAATLPVLVDEAFYAWEGRWLAWAYSDLPGLSAWLSRLGVEIAGQHVLAMRLPFLLIGVGLPWLVLGISRRWFGETAGYQAGLLAMLMPLSGLLGVLALPDVPLVFAALLCLDAIARLREKVQWRGVMLLALALAVGALSHYRFALVVVAGMLGLLLDERGRRLLAEPRFWLAIVLGALAWMPLLAWNFGHDAAGLRFQVVDRNPWQFQPDGWLWLPVQALLVTPVLFALLAATLRHAWRQRSDRASPWALIAGVGAVSVLGYFLLGFFADRERVSFHWPVAGWLVLIVAAPAVMAQWHARWRLALFASATAGLLLATAFLAGSASPAIRTRLIDTPLYPADFAGTSELVGHARGLGLGDGDLVIAGDFSVAAKLAFALDRRDIHVLDSPPNHKHGRAAQLRLWGLQHEGFDGSAGARAVLVVEDTATPLKLRLGQYQRLCSIFGTLPAPEVLDVDHGRKRFLIYRFPAAAGAGCAMPALAWIDQPLPGAAVEDSFVVTGWAFKDGEGLAGVDILVDGEVLARAEYGQAMPHVAQYWRTSRDPAHPGVGFSATVDVSGLPPGAHWLGLRLRGRSGGSEDWAGQKLRID